MKNKLKLNEKEKISSIFCNVMEIMSFTFCEIIEDADETGMIPKNIIQSEITFSGHKSGKMTLVLPIELSAVILSNTLGKDINEPLKISRASDAVKEILNITCGNFLTELYGKNNVFVLTPPENFFPDSSLWNSFKKNPEAVFFRVDNWPVCLISHIDKKE